MTAVERPTTLILYSTAGALVAGGVLWFVDMTSWANVAWAVAGSIPLMGFVRDMVGKLRSGRPGVDVIALLAVGGALALGEFLTAGVIGLMLATGQFLDAYAAGRAERELTALLRRAPRVAHRFEAGEIRTVDLADVLPGDRLLVKPGDVVPVDGTVAGPAAHLDESALTGEPMPAEHPPGDVVPSGAVNAAGAFEMQAAASAERSTYAGIVRLVKEAHESRAPVVRLADRWAAWFVPVALITAGVAWAMSGDPVRGLAVLVVATPCPLLLAVPVAIVSGVSHAAKRGIIFRGGAPLETLARTRYVVLDKTGTLTMGQPVVRRMTVLEGGIDEDRALSLAASVEQLSTHVLARAIVAEARRRGVDLHLPHDLIEEPGGGVAASVDGHRVTVGNAGWVLGDRSEPRVMQEHRRRLMRVAPLSTFISVDGAVVAAASFDDVIRADAASAIRALRRAGVEHVVLATGDHPEVAQSVGLAVGMDEVLAECAPSEKVERLNELRTLGTTAMVGDGINDAPALAAADVGVAMGARGATASSEAADVVLMVDRLQRLVDAVHIAQRSRRIALQSVGIGMGLSLAAMGVAAVGLLPPIAGAVIQEVIDVVAIGNALRARGGDRGRERLPKLSPQLSQRLRAEHDELAPRLESLRTTADELDRLTSSQAHRRLREIRDFLELAIVPHEREDERTIYPEIASALGGEDPLASMSRSHREIFHLVGVYGRILDDLPETGPGPADLRDLRRLLYSLHAILRLHFDQEEELYGSLDENYLSADNAVVRDETRAGRGP